MAFVNFMVSPIGRLLRITAGVVLIALGLMVLQGAGGLILAVVGLVPLLAGALDVCIFAPLFGASFYGAENRSQQTPR
jgi:hypothetical protein